jgi:hypothetical protein
MRAMKVFEIWAVRGHNCRLSHVLSCGAITQSARKWGSFPDMFGYRIYNDA